MVSLSLPSQLTPKPRTALKGTLVIKTPNLVYEQRRTEWNALFCQGVGKHSLKKHDCLHQYTYQSPYFHSLGLKSPEEGHHHVGLCSHPLPVLNGAFSPTADLVEAQKWNTTEQNQKLWQKSREPDGTEEKKKLC